MNDHAPIGGRLLTKPFMLFALLAVIGLYFIAERFIFGLGAVTHINDGYPWGIWIVIDVMIGTAFGCAGYAVALVVYILNKGQYHPLVRPAVLAGLFGYTLAGIAVIIDLGRYWQFYNLVLPWYAQPKSVMLEVALCVMAYVVVLWIEFAPAFLERFGLHRLRDKLSKVLFVIIALGVLLPTMHQSSLGTLAVVFGHRLSPLWQSQLLPVMFLVSALLMGFAIVPFEGMLATLGFKRSSETKILGRLTNFTLVVLALFLVVRFADLLARGALGAAFTGDAQALSFWVETMLFALPLVLLGPGANRFNSRLIFISAVCLLLAGSLYRFNIYLIGFSPASGSWAYFPSVPEIMVTLGMFSLEIVLYLIFVKTLPVLHGPRHA